MYSIFTKPQSDIDAAIDAAKSKVNSATTWYEKTMAGLELQRVEEMYANIKRFDDNWDAIKAARDAYDASFNTPSTNSVDIIASTVSIASTVPVASTIPIASTVPSVIAENNSMSEGSITSEPDKELATKKTGGSKI